MLIQLTYLCENNIVFFFSTYSSSPLFYLIYPTKRCSRNSCLVFSEFPFTDSPTKSHSDPLDDRVKPPLLGGVNVKMIRISMNQKGELKKTTGGTSLKQWIDREDMYLECMNVRTEDANNHDR